MADTDDASSSKSTLSPTAPPMDQGEKNLRGMAMMALAMGTFSLNDTLTKSTSAELPTGEIIAIRGIFAVLLLGPVVIYKYGLHAIPRAYSMPLVVRNVSEIITVILFLQALFRLPLANVTAILQTLPLTMTAAAAILFKEPVGWRRWTAASVGLLGVLLIVRPGSDEFSWWYVAAIVSVFFITARDVATKYITGTVPSLVIAFITALVVLAAGLGMSVVETWVVPSFSAVARLGAAAVLVLIGYVTMVECWRDAEMSAVAPFRYTVVLWAMVNGFVFLGEVPSWWTVGGSLVVVAAGLYTFHRERVRTPR